MKIVIITNLFWPDARGGAERVAELQAKGLRQAGHEVVIFTSGPPQEPAYDEKDGLRIFRYYPGNIFWYKNMGKHNFLTRFIWHIIDALSLHGFIALNDFLTREKPDLNISHNIRGLGMSILLALADRKEKWIHVLHDVQYSVPSGLLIRGQEAREAALSSKMARWYFGNFLNSPRLVISPSQWLLDYYKNYGFFKDSKCAVLQNPVVMPPIAQKTASSVARFLYLGQIEEHKGIVWLAQEIKKLAGDWELAIAGDGRAMEKLKQAAGQDQRIKILGRVGREQIPDLFSRTDLTIVPSLCYENSPAVIYESLAAGVPVLAARIGGVGELIEENKNGWTFEAGSSEELLGQLKQIVSQSRALSAMQDDCRRSVAGFNLEEYIKKLLGLV